MAGPTRYDGIAAWYDDEVRSGPAAGVTAVAVATTAELLGPGPGRCLDLGCGTGVALPTLTAQGWDVVGIDVSLDQLRVARERVGPETELRQADAASLPFPDGTFDAVVAVLVHTDLDDVGAAYREAARVLRPGGRFVHVGTHPCFCAPGVERRDGSPHRLHAGYRARGWREDGPGFGAGIRPRVGVNHVPLAGLLQAVLEAGIAVDAVVEPGDEDYPTLLAVAGWQRLARMRD